MKEKIKIGNLVKFYDCDQARRDRDYSGENIKHYPIGKVIDVYNHKCPFSGQIDEVCDIEIDNRISRGHFTSGVELVKS
jgi:hypothetical protein